VTEKILAALLTRLTDPALAESITGDLVQERRNRARSSSLRAQIWFLATGIALLCRAGWTKVRDQLIDLTVHRFGASGAAGEVRQTCRALTRTPVASGVIVATIALGIAVNAAVFSVVYGVLFQPLPFENPGEIVMIEGAAGDRPPSIFGTSLEDFHDIARTSRSFAGLAIAGYWTFNLTDLDVPQRIVGAAVNGAFFQTLGTRPVLGRWIEPADDRAGAPVTFVISHGLWQRQFGGRADIIGHAIRANGTASTIVGVMPASFRFPGEDVEVWTAIREEMDGTPRNVRFWSVFGRLKRGVSIEQATADVRAIASQLETTYPNTNRDWRVVLVPALEAVTTRARDGLMLLFAAVVMVLAVAAINVAGLLASRRAARGRELAVRVAIGATTPRLVRLALLESAFLGIAGLAIGLLLAIPAVSLLRASAPATLPRAMDVGLHWPVIGMATSAVLLLVLAGGCAPLAWRSRRRTIDVRAIGSAPAPTHRAAAGTALGPFPFPRRVKPTWSPELSAQLRGDASSRQMGTVLVVAQIALAFVVLAGAALLFRSFMRVTAVDPGFRADHLLTLRVFLGPPSYRTIESQRLFAERALDTLRATPGVQQAGAVSQPPFDTEGSGTSQRFMIEGQAYQSGAQPSLVYRTADAGYLDTIGLRLVRGRWINHGDRVDSPNVVVINQTMARQFFPGADPIGARIQWADTRSAQALTIVGIVADVATNGLERSEPPVAYGPYTQRALPFLRWLTFAVRTGADPVLATPAIRRALQSVDARQPVYSVRTMDEIVARSLAERRFSLLLMTAFAALTVVLATLGLYGALAQRVELRRREIGVRMSLGATASRVFALVIRQGLTMVAVGLTLGVIASYLLGELIASLLFGITAHDALARLIVAVAIAIVSLAACLIPARRAAAVDPIVALKDN
jgi:putative ABC transport system permease protein